MFTVTDVDNPISTVIVTATSTNQAFVKNVNINVLGNGQARSIVLIPETVIGETVVTVTANDGVATTSTEFNYTVFSVTGISEWDLGIKIFPNPFGSFINVSLDGRFENGCLTTLHDLLGHEVLSQTIPTGESTLNVKELRDGIYILSIFENSGNVLYRNRIIKK